LTFGAGAGAGLGAGAWADPWVAINAAASAIDAAASARPKPALRALKLAIINIPLSMAPPANDLAQ
jgi:hypothetical protein